MSDKKKEKLAQLKAKSQGDTVHPNETAKDIKKKKEKELAKRKEASAKKTVPDSVKVKTSPSKKRQTPKTLEKLLPEIEEHIALIDAIGKKHKFYCKSLKRRHNVRIRNEGSTVVKRNQGMLEYWFYGKNLNQGLIVRDENLLKVRKFLKDLKIDFTEKPSQYDKTVSNLGFTLTKELITKIAEFAVKEIL